MTSFWDDFWEVSKNKFVGGMCEVEPKSMNSVEMKRQHICGQGHVRGAL
jgi:hypothetical protein